MLPMSLSIPSAEPAPPELQSILVIDDDAREIRLLSEMLRTEGYRLFAALCGEDGFKRALAHRPSLVLLDLHMPGLNGQETCRLFKGAPELAATPIIFLTGSALLEDKLLAFTHGAVDYVTKPFSAPEVIARIRVHLRIWRQNAAGPSQANAPETAGGHKEHDGLVGSTPFADSGERMVRQAQLKILGDLAATPGLAELARSVGTNERRLTEEFRRHTGMAVFEYLRQERFRAACGLLLHSEKHVSQIASAMGFRSVAAFTHAFHTNCGMTPTQYRKYAGMAWPTGADA